jgi:beta-galactosidase
MKNIPTLALCLTMGLLVAACSGDNGSSEGSGIDAGAAMAGQTGTGGAPGATGGSPSPAGGFSSGGKATDGSDAGRSGTGGFAAGGSTSGRGGASPAGGASGVGGAQVGGTPGGGAFSGGASAAKTGGTTAVAGSGGASPNGGTVGMGGVGGGAGSGGSPVPVGTPEQGYDGARGKSFNDGWKFHLGDASGAEQPGYDDSSWTSLSVPHDWSPALGMSQSAPGRDGEGYSTGGIGWYRKTFTLGSAYAGQRIRIEFDGVYMQSEVWINGTKLGAWPYGYTTFQYDLTQYAKTDGSSNVLAVRVDDQQPNSRWYTGAGIYRNVWLTVLDPVHIAFNGAFVTTPTVSASSAEIAVATEIENQSTSVASVQVTTTLYDPRGGQVATDSAARTEVAAGSQGTASQKLALSHPELWSIEAPTLYRAEIQLSVGDRTVDTYTVPVGLRWTQFDPDTGFYLNDQPMKIWGVCDHHDLGALGSAVHVRAIERQLEILKGMGTNGIRTSHNPPAPELLDLADRMGFLIMDEAFDVWETGKNGLGDYHLYFDDWAQRDIQAMVRRDRNHPSVIMWSIGNEIGGATAATGTKLRDWVKAVDATRPVTWGANHMKDDQGQRAVAAILDLQGYNYFVGDANTDTGNFQLDQDHQANPKWAVFGSEELSNVKSRGIYYTQNKDLHWRGCDDSTKQCSSYDIGWGDGMNTQEMFLISIKRPYFFGQFDWTGFDYGGEPTPYGWPSKSSYFGIIDTAGFPKDIYYFYQSKLTTAPMVHILPHWNWTTGTTVWVWVYSNCESVELLLNDKSLGSKSFEAETTTRVEWDVPWESGTLRAEGKRGGTVVAQQEIKTAGEPAQLELTPDRTEIRADGRDLSFVTADIQDSSGVFAPTASNSITFAVSGPGKIAGVDNGNPIDTTSYTSPTRKAFSGKALVIVQSTGEPGPITVTATSSGLTQGTASVTAK